ncbi:hypothetical protein DL767_003275 [Monosporascus sp. MG133]|nr:hypothetical protein DL767_003275 [Monosporascus sp. MG133]
MGDDDEVERSVKAVSEAGSFCSCSLLAFLIILRTRRLDELEALREQLLQVLASSAEHTELPTAVESCFCSHGSLGLLDEVLEEVRALGDLDVVIGSAITWTWPALMIEAPMDLVRCVAVTTTVPVALTATEAAAVATASAVSAVRVESVASEAF